MTAEQCIATIKALAPTTRAKAMARVAELADGQPISDWDPARVVQLAAYLDEIDPAREAGALQLAPLKLTECQQITAAALAEHVGTTWPIDEAFAGPDDRYHRGQILDHVAEHHDRLAQVWADVDHDAAKMRAAIITALGLASGSTTIGDVLGSLTIDTAGDDGDDSDEVVDWEAIASQQLSELYQLRDDVIGKAGDIDRIMSVLSDGVQDVIDRIESMFPSEGDTINE